MPGGGAATASLVCRGGGAVCGTEFGGEHCSEAQGGNGFINEKSIKTRAFDDNLWKNMTVALKCKKLYW